MMLQLTRRPECDKVLQNGVKKIMVSHSHTFSPHELTEIRVDHLPMSAGLTRVPFLGRFPRSLYSLGVGARIGVDEI